jgi:hypothetical protein
LGGRRVGAIIVITVPAFVVGVKAEYASPKMKRVIMQLLKSPSFQIENAEPPDEMREGDFESTTAIVVRDATDCSSSDVLMPRMDGIEKKV